MLARRLIPLDWQRRHLTLKTLFTRRVYRLASMAIIRYSNFSILTTGAFVFTLTALLRGRMIALEFSMA
jgi:hypothetical protein